MRSSIHFSRKVLRLTSHKWYKYGVACIFLTCDRGLKTRFLWYLARIGGTRLALKLQESQSAACSTGDLSGYAEDLQVGCSPRSRRRRRLGRGGRDSAVIWPPLPALSPPRLLKGAIGHNGDPSWCRACASLSRHCKKHFHHDRSLQKLRTSV